MILRVRARVRALLMALRNRAPVHCAASAKLPTEYGDFDIRVYTSAYGGDTHVALVCGEIGGGENVLTHIHSACLTSDIFHSAHRDCGPQLHTALKRIAEEGRGVLLYLGQEHRGLGLVNRICANGVQNGAVDPVEANERLDFPADSHHYHVGVQMLRDLGVRSTRLLDSNPKNQLGVTGDGLSVSERLVEISASALM